jgi:protein-tyrosine phosphatase
MQHARRFREVREVPDPYYGAPAGFELVLDLVEDACDGLVAALQRGDVEGTS